jgi:hypothetical protein
MSQSEDDSTGRGASVTPGDESRVNEQDGEKTIPEAEVAPEEVPATEDEPPSPIEGTP